MVKTRKSHLKYHIVLLYTSISKLAQLRLTIPQLRFTTPFLQLRYNNSTKEKCQKWLFVALFRSFSTTTPQSNQKIFYIILYLNHTRILPNNTVFPFMQKFNMPVDTRLMFTLLRTIRTAETFDARMSQVMPSTR